MTAEARAAMGAAAVEAARAVGYVGAGTVEFIADGSAGLRPEALPLRQADVRLDGHAVEARIYAEDPARGFLPSTGRLVAWDVPAGSGIRVDSGVERGDAVTPFYDPMLAKVIAHGATRDIALTRLAETLARTVAVGPSTNVGFLTALCENDAFRRGGVDTGFIDRNLALLGAVPGELDRAAVASGVARLMQRDLMRRHTESTAGDDIGSPWDAMDGFQFSGARVVTVPVIADGVPVTATASFGASGVAVSVENTPAAADAQVFDGSSEVYVLRGGRQTIVRHRDFAEITLDDRNADGFVRAPMHGKVLDVLVEPGGEVRKGQRIAVIEAMKMEHALTAPVDGIVGEIAAQPGTQVAEGSVILRIDIATEAR
jgi:3-methylcrotonyl-CoA carboxylase alpha subunit